MIDKSINAGIDAQTGFALQRNSALYLLLEEYHTKFKEKKYFICLEHHDDFLFCFLNDNDEAEVIEAYQSKKKAPSSWKLDINLISIIKKLLETGKSLIDDKIVRSKDYKHVLFFSTNQTINLKVYEKGKKKIKASESIKANNTLVKFKELDDSIKQKITEDVNDNDLNTQLEHLKFIWLDINNTVEKQENELVGQIDKVFNSQIYNPRAALNTIIKLFNDVEYIYNQKDKADLLDEKKRISSVKIEETFYLLTNKSKCFDYWRSQKREVSKVLKIKPADRETFEFAFDTAFDFFKSYNEAEHRKILEFVKLNISNCTTYSDEENVAELVYMFSKTDFTHLGEIEFKAIVFAAFYEVNYKH